MNITIYIYTQNFRNWFPTIRSVHTSVSLYTRLKVNLLSGTIAPRVLLLRCTPIKEKIDEIPSPSNVSNNTIGKKQRENNFLDFIEKITLKRPANDINNKTLPPTEGDHSAITTIHETTKIPNYCSKINETMEKCFPLIQPNNKMKNNIKNKRTLETFSDIIFMN